MHLIPDIRCAKTTRRNRMWALKCVVEITHILCCLQNFSTVLTLAPCATRFVRVAILSAVKFTANAKYLLRQNEKTGNSRPGHRSVIIIRNGQHLGVLRFVISLQHLATGGWLTHKDDNGCCLNCLFRKCTPGQRFFSLLKGNDLKQNQMEKN